MSKVPPDLLDQLEQPQTYAPSMPLVKRSHVRRTKQSSLQFAKVAVADRLCRMALFDVLARAELLDFASENNRLRHVFGLKLQSAARLITERLSFFGVLPVAYNGPNYHKGN